MSSFPVEIKGLSELLTRLSNASASLVKAVDIELKDGSEQIAATAKNQAPANTGTLRQGIGAEKKADLNYTVFSNADYSAYVEFGTGAKVLVPAGLESFAAQFKGGGGSALSAKDAIFAWCKDKGIDQKAWYAIYISIMTNGVEPQPFFFSAKDAQEPTIIKGVQDALKSAI